MLQLNMTRAMKLPAARDYAIPAPFPGKYPTRVGMMVEWERGGKTGHWRYVGKPNSIVAKKFEVEVAKGGLRLLAIMEWDRAWQISQTVLSWPEPTRREQVANAGLQVKSPWLWTVYHPWHEQRGDATVWMRQGIHVHRVGCALGENTRLYSPLPELGGIYIADYRKRVNVVGQQPAQKKRKSLTEWGMEMNGAWAPAQPPTVAWNNTVVAPQPPVEATPEPAWRTLAQRAREMQQEVTQAPTQQHGTFWNGDLDAIFGRTR